MRRLTTRYGHYSAIYLFLNQFSWSAVNVVNMVAVWYKLIATPNSTPLGHSIRTQWHPLAALMGDKHNYFHLTTDIVSSVFMSLVHTVPVCQCGWLDTNNCLRTNGDITLLI